MKLTRSLLLVIASALTAAASTTEKLDQTCDVTPGGKLVVDVDFGAVNVAAGSDDKATVEAERKIDSHDTEKEKEYFAAVPITVTREGNTVTVRARRVGSHHDWSWGGSVTMDAHYDVRVPKSFNVELRTGGGSIDASGLSGTATVKTSGGKLRFTNLNGPIDAKTSGGSIAMSGCAGELQISTSGGEIDVTGGSGTLRARTSGGSVAVRDFGGNTDVQTSGGRLTLTNIAGGINGRTSGGSITAAVPAPVPGDIRLQTSAGRIEVTVPKDAGLNLEAHAASGRVDTDLPFTGERGDREALRGTLNGGGKALVLQSDAGSISIHARDGETVRR